MTTFSDGLHEIRSALDLGIEKLIKPEDDSADVFETATLRQVGHAVEQLSQFNSTLEGIKGLLESQATLNNQSEKPTPTAPVSLPEQKIEVINKVPQAFSNIIEAQFRILQTWLEPLLKLAETMPEVEGLVKATKLTEKQYKRMMSKFDEESSDEEEAPRKQTTSAKKKTATRKKRSTRKKKS